MEIGRCAERWELLDIIVLLILKSSVMVYFLLPRHSNHSKSEI